jgi:hypothetical protein
LSRKSAASYGLETGDNRCMPSEDAVNRAYCITVRRYASALDADRRDLEFWMRVSAADRVLLVWQLSLEQWQLKVWNSHSQLSRL